MVSTARIFFAGVGTTFGILAVGFGAGAFLATSTMNDISAQKRATKELPAVSRVIYPTSAEPALQAIAAVPETKPVAQPAPELQAPPERQVEKAEPKKRRELRTERRKPNAERYAERKARRNQRLEAPRQESPGILAFGRDEPQPLSLFGN